MLKGIRSISPYLPGAQPNVSNMIKINTNENAYPPSPKVKLALETFDTDELVRYSSLHHSELKQTLAKQYGLNEDQFVISNGSDEVLAFAMLAFFNSDQAILFPDITYGFYTVWADLFHIPYQEIPLNSEYEVDLSDYNQPNGGIILANPNAPTGHYHEPERIKTLLENNPESVVIIDEAYIDFGGESVVSLIQAYPNLVVTHTFSKSRSLAGLRVGYAMSNPELIQVLEAVKSSFNPYSVDTLADIAATAAAKDTAYYTKINQAISQTRETFVSELAALGFQSLPSKTNFILTTHPTLDIPNLFAYLESKHIFVRYFSKPERLNRFLRISIGTDEEMNTVLTEIAAYQNKHS